MGVLGQALAQSQRARCLLSVASAHVSFSAPLLAGQGEGKRKWKRIILWSATAYFILHRRKSVFVVDLRTRTQD